MSNGVIIWMSLFAIFAVIFFSIAAIVSVKGIADIKEIMNDPELKSND